MRHCRPSLSTTPYPVGPTAAGSTPSTRIHTFFSCTRSPLIATSLRPSPRSSHFFTCKLACKSAEEQLTVVFHSEWGLQNSSPAASVRADRRLNFRFVDIEVGVYVLHVIMFFECFDQSHHLHSLRAGQLDVVLRHHADFR